MTCTVELRLITLRQRLTTLLYLNGRVSARALMQELHGCEELQLLRLPPAT